MAQMTKEAANAFFAELFNGEHHIPAKLHEFGDGWSLTTWGDLSTFDFDMLTRLVFLAHDRCVRATVMQGAPKTVKIVLWQRESREGSINKRHPTIEQALEDWRKYHPIWEAK
jgi:hypothetical protein